MQVLVILVRGQLTVLRISHQEALVNVADFHLGSLEVHSLGVETKPDSSKEGNADSSQGHPKRLSYDPHAIFLVYDRVNYLWAMRLSF